MSQRDDLLLVREAHTLVEISRENPAALNPAQRQKLRTVRDLIREIRQRWNRTPDREVDDELDDLILKLTTLRDSLP